MSDELGLDERCAQETVLISWQPPETKPDMHWRARSPRGGDTVLSR